MEFLGGHGDLPRVAAHAVAGCASAAAGGGKCGQGAMAAGFAEFAGPRIKVGEEIAANVVKHAVIGGIGSELGGGKFANGAMSGAFGYLFNRCGQGCQEELGKSPVKALWDQAQEHLRFVRVPDSLQGELSFYVAATNVIVSRDLDLFFSLSTLKSFPYEFKRPGWSLTAQFIDGGQFMGDERRSGVIGGGSAGSMVCAGGGCVGRQWSATDAGPVGTTSIGIGTPGVTLISVGNTSKLGNLSTAKCTSDTKC